MLAACHERVVVKPYAHSCVSRSVADELRAGRGLDPVGTPNGVVREGFATTHPAARAVRRTRLGPYVLTVGRIGRRRRVPDRSRRRRGRVRWRRPPVGR
ncbi:hypothetical protein HEP87_62535 [Streptomyces sp. S1D4-11]